MGWFFIYININHIFPMGLNGILDIVGGAAAVGWRNPLNPRH